MKTLPLFLLLSLCPVGIIGLHAQAVRIGGDQAGYIVRSPDSEGGAAWTYHGNDGSSVNGYSTPYSVTVNPSSYQPGWYETLHHSEQITQPIPAPAPVQPLTPDPLAITPCPQYYPVPVPARNQQPSDESSKKLQHSLASLPEPLRKKFWSEVKTDFKVSGGQQLRADYLLAYYRLWFRTRVITVPATQ